MKKAISFVLVLALGLPSMSLAAEDTWTKKTDTPTARYEFSTSVVKGLYLLNICLRKFHSLNLLNRCVENFG